MTTTVGSNATAEQPPDATAKQPSDDTAPLPPAGASAASETQPPQAAAEQEFDTEVEAVVLESETAVLASPSRDDLMHSSSQSRAVTVDLEVPDDKAGEGQGQ